MPDLCRFDGVRPANGRILSLVGEAGAVMDGLQALAMNRVFQARPAASIGRRLLLRGPGDSARGSACRMAAAIREFV